MRNQLVMLLVILSSLTLCAQTMVSEVSIDSMMNKTNTKPAFCNILRGGGKYLFNSSKNTRETLASAGYVLDQPAIEYYVQYKDLPKIFYFQQLGTISSGKYTSINGFGIKKDIRKALVAMDNIMLTPYAEFGAGYYRLSVIEGVGESSSINAVLDGGVQQRTLDNITITGDLGLDLGFGFKFDDRRMMLVLSGGYLTNFPTQWRSAGSIAFNEKLNIMSPYAGISLALDMNCGDGCCK